MTIEQTIVETLRVLPQDKQQEVLDFARFLAQKQTVKRPLRSVKGLCAHLGVSITAEEIDDARREMWGNFPREDV
jgi:hypothetical protein